MIGAVRSALWTAPAFKCTLNRLRRQNHDKDVGWVPAL